MIKEILKNVGLTYHLKPKYYRLTSTIGLIGGAAGLALGMYLLLSGANYLDVNASTPVEGGFNKFLMLASVIFVFTVAIYLGCTTAAGIFSIYMLLTGKFSTNQARGYTFFSRYPESWFREKP